MSEPVSIRVARRMSQSGESISPTHCANLLVAYDALRERVAGLEGALREAQETCEYACDTKTADEWCLLCKGVAAALGDQNLNISTREDGA